MKKTLILMIALVMAVAACGDGDGATAPGVETTTTTSPDDPISSEDPTTTTTLPPDRTEPGPAFVDSVEILLMESWPVQVAAAVTGSLPNPCHTLTWEVSEPDADGRITLEVSSLFDPAEVCVEMIQEFEENIRVGDFTTGDFVLVVNGVDYLFSI